MEIKNAMVAMSGGVDSSVAAYLTKKDGLHCIGAIARMCDEALLGDAYTTQNISDAQAVAQRLEMDFYVIDAVAPFKSGVVNSFIDAYEQGLTPTPALPATNASSLIFCWKRLWKWVATAL